MMMVINDLMKRTYMEGAWRGGIVWRGEGGSQLCILRIKKELTSSPETGTLPTWMSPVGVFLVRLLVLLHKEYCSFPCHLYSSLLVDISTTSCSS